MVSQPVTGHTERDIFSEIVEGFECLRTLTDARLATQSLQLSTRSQKTPSSSATPAPQGRMDSCLGSDVSSAVPVTGSC